MREPTPLINTPARSRRPTETYVDVQAQFPPKLAPLFARHRYKILYGGRGGSKSWSIARALLLMAQQNTLRVLCLREHQASMQDSVHKLLCDQVYALGLEEFYHIEKATIRGKNGSEFRFSGIKSNVHSIKSMEGITHAWVEEAQNVTKTSWDILIPTIRRPHSEIIISFNPELETDETWVRFVLNTPPDAVKIHLNYYDNPWFPEALRREAERLREVNLDDFRHIYLGECRKYLDGAIYANELRMAEDEGRITTVPYDPRLPLQAFWDLGYADATAIWLAQKVGFETHVIDYVEDSRKTLEHYLSVLAAKPYSVERHFLPPDARAKQLGSGQSIEEMMRAKGHLVSIVPGLTIADGINAVRSQFPAIWFDRVRCQDGLQALRHYKFEMQAVLQSGHAGFKDKPVHDRYSHGCLTAEAVVDTARGPIRIDAVLVGDQVWTPAGYSRVLFAGPIKQVGEVLCLTAADGRRLRCTPEHKLFTAQGLRPAEAVRPSETLWSGQEAMCRWLGWLARRSGRGFRALTTALTPALTALSTLTRWRRAALRQTPPLTTVRRAVLAAPVLVYDLTVENHACYRANGFLVSNSDSFRYMCIALKPPKDPIKRKYITDYRSGNATSWMGM